MRKPVILISTTVISLVDIVLSTILFCRGKHFSLFDYLFEYTFTSSVFELWCLSILRASVLLGLVFGVLKNPQAAVFRIKSARALFYYVAAILCMFTLIKLLAVSEHETFIHNIWFWCLLSWCLMGSIVFAIVITILGNVKVTQSDRFTTLKINSDDSETQPLIGEKKEGNTAEKEPNELSGKVSFHICCISSLWQISFNSLPYSPLF